MAGISEGEVAVYDRQLRLWGVQAQQRLMKSKVLIWGLEGIQVELCKNLILAGVAVTVRDHREVTAADVAFNYFLRDEDLGKNRAECAAVRFQEMNPLSKMGSIIAAPEAEEAGLKKALEGFDVVCLGLGVLGWDVKRASTIDALCRQTGSTFVQSVSAGEFAFFFTNMHEHTVQEKSGAQAGAGSVAATGQEAAAAEHVSFPSFAEWLSATPADLQSQKVDPSILLITLFFAFLQQDAGSTEADAPARFAAFCRDSAKVVPTIDGVELEHIYSCLFVEPLVHVASIVGGLLTQEVIKAITKRDPPLANCLCFSAFTGAAVVERIPAASAAKKRKIEEECLDLDD